MSGFFSEILWAASNGKRKELRKIIEEGGNVNKRSKCRPGYEPVYNDHDYTPLMCAVENGHEKCARLLLQNGANVEARDEKGKTALHKAAENGHISCLKELIRYGASVNVKSEDASTPLHDASEAGHYGIIEKLLQKGADINALDDNQMPPLHWACIREHYLCAKMLLTKGANVNIKISEVCLDRFSDSMILMLGSKVPVSDTVLHLAGKMGNVPLVELLIKHGVNVQEKDIHGNTALVCAIKMLEDRLSAKSSMMHQDNFEVLVIRKKKKKDNERIMRQKETIQTLLEFSTDFTVNNKILAETVGQYGLLLPCELDMEYLALNEDWCNLDVAPIFLLFDSHAIRRQAFKLVCSGCKQMGWVNEGKHYLNMAVFSINQTKTACLVLTTIPTGTPNIKIEIFYPRAQKFRENIIECLPSVLNSVLQAVNRPEIDHKREIAPHFNPCYDSGKDYNNCFISYSKDKLSESGDFVLGICKDHYKNVHSWEINPWFQKPEDQKLNFDFQNENSLEKCLWEAANHITNETILYDIGLELRLLTHEIETFRTDNPSSIVLAGYKMLLSWKNKYVDLSDLHIIKEKLSDAFLSCNMGSKVGTLRYRPA